MLVPEVIDNAPGQSTLSYRVGTYATFFESMLAWLVWPPEAPARCSELDPETEPDPLGDVWPLRELTSRESDDPTIALLDAWAIVGDVLTFYQERIANEGFLRTATEQQSVEAIARLVGHRPRPGVAASVDLAFTLDREVVTTIPAGTRAQSLPAPGKLPQSFETSAPLVASARWNALRPLQSKFLWPQAVGGRLVVYLAGTATNLRVNDVVYRPRPAHVHEAESPEANNGVAAFHVVDPLLFRVERVDVLADLAATRVYLRPYSDEDDVYGSHGPEYTEVVDGLVGSIVKSFTGTFDDERDRLAGGRFRSEREVLEFVQNDRVLRESFRRALQAVWASRASKTQFFVFRASSALFGHNAAAERYVGGEEVTTPWPSPGDEGNRVVFLDVVNERIEPHDYVVIDRAASKGIPASLSLHRITDVRTYSRDAYGIAKQTMKLALDSDWIEWPEGVTLAPLRSAVVYHESESLQVARTPLDTLEGSLIELEGLIFDLQPGRTLIVEGEAADAPGALRTERVTIAAIEHDLVDLSTHITLTRALARSYRRNRTIIYGNVASATQGETRVEVLGSGDASKPSQAFTLRHKPLTYVPADTPEGVASTLTVRVQGYAWPEAMHRSLLGPRDRKIVTRIDEQGRTIVIGGEGRHGARFPTGVENITAEYRSGLGSDGNIDPHRATNLATRPYGVQKVTNPMSASGGGDPDDIEATRTRAHLAVEALDRLLSVEDHRSFALRFAGIAKARATREGSGGVYARWRVRTVVAGVDARPLDPEGELIGRLHESMRLYGDPSLAIEVIPASLARLRVRARVAITHGYTFVEVESRLRPALLDALSYARQGIGQPIWPSRVVALAQAVAGVDFLDLDELGIADGVVDAEPLIFDPGQSVSVQPDTVLYLDPDLSENLVLEELTR